ncbi:hypothetical protein ACIP93_18925 [Streptomyces sp. NPDC088745]|uniref:hypothetical protein n=1 Tax=Streptomyces sp. NPDC088745 TaxID=3365884 RepID=UPI00381C5C22
MRRIAFVLAGVTAAGFLAVTPAVADDGDDLAVSQSHASGNRFEQEREDGYEHYNIGGPHGLTAETGGEMETSGESFDLSHTTVNAD